MRAGVERDHKIWITTKGIRKECSLPKCQNQAQVASSLHTSAPESYFLLWACRFAKDRGLASPETRLLVEAGVT